MLSDDSTSDSDAGVRFKTDATRHRERRSRSPRSSRSSKRRSRSRHEEKKKKSRKSDESSGSRRRTPDLRERLKAKHQCDVESAKDTNSCENEQIEGPALPPHLLEKMKREKETRVLGPSIPQNFREELANDVNDRERIASSEDDEVVGPLPEGSEDKWSRAHRNLEERALKFKIDSMDGGAVEDSSTDIREEWMLKLPENKGLHLGLTSRQFKARAGPDMSDRSNWTDTPQEKALKAAGVYVFNEETEKKKIERDAEREYIRKRDSDQEALIKKHKKKNKRDQSLLEMHQKKLKKKKKKSDKEKDSEVRRPFSRDVDLQVNRFDEAQKKAILKKAQLLDSRFSRGESKFL